MQIEKFKELLDEDELRYEIQKSVGSQIDVFVSSSQSSLLEDRILLEITLVYEAFDRNSYMHEEIFGYLIKFDDEDRYVNHLSTMKFDDDYIRRKTRITEVVKDYLKARFS